VKILRMDWQTCIAKVCVIEKKPTNYHADSILSNIIIVKILPLFHNPSVRFSHFDHQLWKLLGQIIC
jgi:hypothetical protein